jgi:hypothetical protein
MVRDHEALGGDSDVPCRPVHIRAAGDDDGTYSDSDPSAAAESCREGSTRRSACGRYETRGGLAQRDRWEEEQSNNAADTLMNPNVSWNHRGWDIETLSWYDDVAGRVLLGFADAGARAAREARGVRHSGDDDMDSDIQEAIPPLYRGLGTSVAGIVPYAGVDLCMNSSRCAPTGCESYCVWHGATETCP